ncbi:MAG: hypothetical protein D3917_06920 [Candidatus Electrothrix sp. AX5]|nr:hypothetical protein [Candidatus Electrothrix sp. AX5]
MRFIEKISKRILLSGRTSGLSTALSVPLFTQGKNFSSAYINDVKFSCRIIPFSVCVIVDLYSCQEQVKTVVIALRKLHVICGVVAIYPLKPFRDGMPVWMVSCAAILLVRLMFFVHESNACWVEEVKSGFIRQSAQSWVILKKVVCGIVISWQGKSGNFLGCRDCAW